MGVLLRGTKREDVERGQVLASRAPSAAHALHGRGLRPERRKRYRHTPFFNGYRPQFYFRTTDVTGRQAAGGYGDGDAGRQHCDDGALIARSRWKRACASPSAKAAVPSAPASSPRSSSNRAVAMPRKGR